MRRGNLFAFELIALGLAFAMCVWFTYIGVTQI